MANEEINDQTAKTTPVTTDEFLLQETGGGDWKKITHGNLTKVSGFLCLGARQTNTVTSNAITPTKSNVALFAGSAVDLNTINGTSEGDIIVLTRAGSFTITVKDAADNLQIAGDFAMDNVSDSMTLMNRDGTNLVELSRSNNA